MQRPFTLNLCGHLDFVARIQIGHLNKNKQDDHVIRPFVYLACL